MKEYLVIIPARCGSKGVPGKNIANIADKPLVAYTIEVANSLVNGGHVREAIVSTDCEEIAMIAREYHAFVPFLRPKEISGDGAKSVDLMLHALDYFKERGVKFEAVILLQPTSPLRTEKDVLEAIRIFEKAKTQSLISVYREEYICDLVSYYKKGNIAIPLSPQHNKGVRRQEHEKLFIRNGAIYITDTGYLTSEKKIIDDIPAVYVMPKNKSINVDTNEDLELIQWILKQE